MEFFRRAVKHALLLSLTGTCALANFEIGFSFQPELLVGTDDQQLVGSTWTLSINVSQSSYGDLQGSNLPYASPDSVQLTITGSGINNNNGTFDLTPSDPENSAVVPYNGTYAYPLITDDGFFIVNVYEFGQDIILSNFNAVGAPVASPLVSDAVLAEHFDGVTLTEDLAFRTTDDPFGNTQYGIPSGTVVIATNIPEPSALLLLAAVSALALSRRSMSPRQ